ncbi:MAG: acyl-CoA/acyl-ACP dehydrogenase [Hydrogenibacillus sp.]|nr:acyl-CoA/acyl-ACP dehydrogenase [Hydrogenibacillus sp.]
MLAIGFMLTDEQRTVIDAVEELLRKLKPRQEAYFKSIYDDQHYPDELWEHMSALGLFGALVPEAYGGSGLGLLAMTLAMERFAAHGLGNVLAVLTTMDAMAILRGGTEAQKRRFLPAIAEGKLRMAFAITEPDAGTNSFRMRTLARKDGSVYRLSGRKAWITGADRADYVLVVARTIPYEEVIAQGLRERYGMGLFLVDTKAEGLSMQAMETVGIEGFRQFFLYLDDVEVPEDHRIGDEHDGAEVMFDALNPERILFAAKGVGMTEYALARAAEYAKARRVFGDTPIAAYQGVQHPLARLKVLQEAARMLTYQAAEAFDRGRARSEVGLFANMAKYLASETAFEAIDRAIQTHGGNGFSKEYHLIRMMAPARLMKTAPINNEMVLNYIAERALGLPRSY